MGGNKMLLRGTDICNHILTAKDGTVGKIQNIYFDDRLWLVRYLIVDTGTWFRRGQVLIVPSAITGINTDPDEFTTSLTRKMVETSPVIESHLPVARQEEERLHQHYAWDPYWMAPLGPKQGMDVYPIRTGSHSSPQDVPVKVRIKQEPSEITGDAHLRSLMEVCKYEVQATDGNIGEIRDLLVDTDLWRVTHLLANTKIWFPDKPVLIASSAVRCISWSDQSVILNMTREDVRHSPEYHYGMTISEAYQKDLSDYYGKLARISETHRDNP